MISAMSLPPSPPPSRSSSQTSVSRKPTTYDPAAAAFNPTPSPPRRQKPTLTLDPTAAATPSTFLASATPTSSTLRSFFSPCTDSSDSDSDSDSDCGSPIQPLRPRGHFQRLWASRPSLPPSTPPPAPFSPHLPPAPSAPHTGVFPPPSPWDTPVLPADPLLRHLHALLTPLLAAASTPAPELRAARAARERAMVKVQKAHFRRGPLDAARVELATAEARERAVERGVVAAFLKRVEGVQMVCKGFVDPEETEYEYEGEDEYEGEGEDEEVWTLAREWPEEPKSAWEDWNDERRFTWVPSRLSSVSASSSSSSSSEDDEDEMYHADPTRDPSFPLSPAASVCSSPSPSLSLSLPSPSLPSNPASPHSAWSAFLPPSPDAECRRGVWADEKKGVDWGVVVVVEGVQMNMI